MRHVPEIKLIRTDTTLDLSQKAEKVCLSTDRGASKRHANRETVMGWLGKRKAARELSTRRYPAEQIRAPSPKKQKARGRRTGP